MRIVYFGNTLNRHQVYVADALNQLTGGEYTYVETVAPTVENSFGGKVRVVRPYVLRAYENSLNHNEALLLSREADVALFGADSFVYEIERMKQNNRLSFDVSERLLKRGWKNMVSPRLLKKLWYYHTRKWSKKPLYKLCAGAYCANDQYAFNTFIDKCYKWGYFTDICDCSAETDTNSSAHDDTTRMMWCARFLDWKHPELPLYLAAKMKEMGYSFVLDMYGCGVQLQSSQALAKQLRVDDVVNFCGNVSNDVILSEMMKHQIFLMTSDRREGWGAVLNEAMSCGCAVVASNEIGAVPYLINDGENGFVFKSENLDSLFNIVVSIIDNPSLCNRIRSEAYRTIKEQWSPFIAAKNLYILCEHLQNKKEGDIIGSGPCSKAYPI